MRISIFAPLVLISFYLVFRPFQMAHYSLATLTQVSLAYLLIFYLSFSAGLIVFPKVAAVKFNELIERTYGRWALVMFHVILIGAFIFTFKISYGFYALNVKQLFTGSLAMMGFLAFVLLLLFILDKPTKAVIKTISLDDNTVLQLSDILYLRSEKNYTVWVCLVDDQIVEFKRRMTLKQAMQMLDGFNFMKQTHRAFVVNESNVLYLEKRQGKSMLQLKGNQQQIPLSKTFEGLISVPFK